MVQMAEEEVCPESDDPDKREAMWRTHIEIAARGGPDMLLPIFEATDRDGADLLPGGAARYDRPAGHVGARRGASTPRRRPNIMVKLPGTAEGIEAVRILTAGGRADQCNAWLHGGATGGDR